MKQALAVKEKYLKQLIRTPGISAVGIGKADDNSDNLAIVVFVVKDSLAASKGFFPASYGNLPVQIKETSGFRLL